MNPRVNAEPEVYDALLAPHLARVSRSFALCIRELDEPLRHWTGLSYLMCRLLDTVEDAPWTEGAQQDAAFERLNRCVETRPTAAAAQSFAQSFTGPLPPGEQALVADCLRVFDALHACPPPVYAAMRRVLGRMAVGMQYYARTARAPGGLRLLDLEDVNRYCYFVAGVVGDLLTDLFVLSAPDFVPSAAFVQHGHHLALFLQKVNVLKDQAGDEREGRHLVPHRPTLVASLREHALGALAYLTALPQKGQGYRTFCAWSVFLGAASLPYIEGTAGTQAPKITREHTRLVLAEIAAIACDNAALTVAMHQALDLMPQAVGAPPSAPLAATAAPERDHRRAFFASLDHRPLSPEALVALGMLPQN